MTIKKNPDDYKTGFLLYLAVGTSFEYLFLEFAKNFKRFNSRLEM